MSKHFDGDGGRITFPEDIYKGKRPGFEKDTICPRCGVLSMDEIELTETGQSRLTRNILE